VLSDAADLQSQVTLDTDICIIGAGPAGITVALELDGQPIRVLLLEGGRLKYHRASQALYKGNHVGLHYEEMHYARSRFFGGSSNCWAGVCRPLDPHDFEAREWVPNSGWPIMRSDLESHYHRAHELLQLGPVNYDPASWQQWIDRRDADLLDLDGLRAINLIAQVSPPTRLGKRYRDAISRSSNISAYLDANVTEIEAPENGAAVTGLRARTLGGGEFRVTARTFILATGGIETPRLLLASNRYQPAGVGNQHDVVGRYFMDHPRLLSGEITFKNPERNSRIYDMHSASATRAAA
jgi:choline dehydrogenase-like flavoprotein